MAQQISQSDMSDFRQLLNDGNVGALYGVLSNRGYKYGYLAGQIISDTKSGGIALKYMGIVAEANAVELNQGKISGIEEALAGKYLDYLQEQIDNKGYADIDVNADTAWEMHTDVFGDYGLPPEAWTLNGPFSALKTTEERDDLWNDILDSVSEGIFPETINNAEVLGEYFFAIDSFDKLDQLGWMASAFLLYLNVPSERVDQVAKVTVATINILANTYYHLAGQPQNLRDPLALDLDNNGITTLPSTDGIIFDHNGSGTKYGTGWINPADGWLALDRNGNDKIDSGRELFGDSTIKLNGNKATDAYDALASFDTNKDGKVDAADATGDTDNDGSMEAGETYWDMNRNGVFNAGTDKTFADLRVWVDADSDAVVDGCESGSSPSCELKTLTDLHIVSIATGKTSGSGVDINGNNNTFKGNYTKDSGEVLNGARAFNLAENKAFREFANTITPANDVLNLPNMQGMGAVRDLHEAMSLGTVESQALRNIVTTFAAPNTTRAAQYALIDKLLMYWSRTSAFKDMAERVNDMTATIMGPTGQRVYTYEFSLTTAAFWNEDPLETNPDRNQKVNYITEGAGDPDAAFVVDAVDNLFLNNPDVLDDQSAEHKANIEALAKLRVLEVFNNAQFFDFTSTDTTTGTDDINTPGDERTHTLTLKVNGQQRHSSDGISSAAPPNIIALTENDLVQSIPQSAYVHASYDQLRESVYSALALQTRLKPYMDAINITLNASGNVVFDFEAMDDMFDEKIAADPINGVLDLIDIVNYRGADLDKSGWDVEAAFALIESTIDDINPQPNSDELAALEAAGFNVQYDAPNNKNMSSEITDNVLTLLQDEDVTGNYYSSVVGNMVVGGNSGENFNGKQGNDVVFGGAGDDSATGNEGDDKLWGGAGNDMINGRAGDDYVSGGVGNDTLGGIADDVGNDWLSGGTGDDGLTDSFGSDVMQGGKGNDTFTLNGTNKNIGDVDTLLFARGDGADTVNVSHKTADQTIVLNFQNGIAPDHVRVNRIGSSSDVLLEVMDVATGTMVEGSIALKKHNSISTNVIDGVVFTNGVVWTQEDIAGLLVYSGTAGHDTIRGSTGADTISGNDGNDLLEGGAGNDTLDGGTGSDVLEGGAGIDTFVFNLGTGHDTVNNVEAIDVVKIGAGILPADLIISRVDEVTIKISHKNGTDSITVNSEMVANNLAKIVLSDGTVLLSAEELAGLQDKVVTLKRDTLDPGYVSMIASDFLGTELPNAEKARWQIGAGSHAVSGFLDNEFYVLPNFMDSGINYLAFLPSPDEGEFDEFVFELYRDADTGLLLNGNVVVTTTTANALMGYDGFDDILDGTTGNSAMTLSGGTGNDLLKGSDSPDVLNGGADNDILNGNWGNDSLYGGAGDDQLGVSQEWGNDTMVGGAGSDTYHVDFLWGDDQDVIHNADATAGINDKDRLDIGAGATDVRELWFTRDLAPATGGDDLIVSMIGKTGTLRIEDWFSSNATTQARLDSLKVKEDDQLSGTGEVIATGDVYTFLLDSHFDSLIQAMAAETAPTTWAGFNASSDYNDVRTAWSNLAVDVP